MPINKAEKDRRVTVGEAHRTNGWERQWKYKIKTKQENEDKMFICNLSGALGSEQIAIILLA